MADVPNHKVLARYKELLANRSHDVIVMDLALEQMEAEQKDLKDQNQKLADEVETLKQALARSGELVRKLKTDAKVIEGEVLETEEK